MGSSGLTIQSVSDLTGLSVQALRRAIDKGEINRPPRDKKGRYVFSDQDRMNVQLYVAELRNRLREKLRNPGPPDTFHASAEQIAEAKIDKRCPRCSKGQKDGFDLGYDENGDVFGCRCECGFSF
jgi:hypothetical protein